MPDQLLHELLSAQKAIYGDPFYKEKVPDIIYDNLRNDFVLRPYQKEAFGRFNFYWDEFPNRPKNKPIQLLYHMATGSGKTLIMAGLLVYLYEKGYRNFLFFVNSTNIIEKTRDNFLNPQSSKYLFAERIQIGDGQIRINEVDNYSTANPDDINIIFTTIQGLHTRLHAPRENAVTFEDFEDQKVVLISDEAHHINAETKSSSRRTKTETDLLNTWESTVNRIVHAHNENVMLEFTATIDLGDQDILEKYRDRVIFDYPLKEFRVDGYSKEVKVLQADLDPVDRALQAVILSQYRLKLFTDHQLGIKPVIMFKSNYVNPPKKPDKNRKVVSSQFREAFHEKMQHLTGDDLRTVKSRSDDLAVISEAFQFFEEKNITLENLALELKEDFKEEKSISVDSLNDAEENQILVNSLEDADNPIRVVFAVDALNEGWDVLNLFDIVRLYDTRDAKKGRPGRSTMAEAQLIGRGARYCPFQIKENQPRYQRKFDVVGSEEEHALKVCEELYYHSAHNSRYVDELHTAMEEIGIKPRRSYQISLNLKSSFKESILYKKGKIFTNKRIKYNREDIFHLDQEIRDHLYRVKLRTGYMVSTTVFEGTTGRPLKMSVRNYTFSQFEPHILKKALHRLPFYHFSTLKKYFPHLKSHTEFIESEDFLALVTVEVNGAKDQVLQPSPAAKLDIAVQVLEQMEPKIRSGLIEYKGTKEFEPRLVKDVISNKELNIARDDGSDREYGIRQSESDSDELRIPLHERDWYAFEDNFGTSEEKRFVRYIAKVYDQLKDRFDQVFLVRNERHFQIYTFDDGRAIEPDFVLFLEKKEPEKKLHYQIFVEPKGDHLLKTDSWKEEFLKGLKEDFELQEVWKGEEYIIWGLPFFNEQNRRREFESEFENILK